jgi:hypothetical protein
MDSGTKQWWADRLNSQARGEKESVDHFLHLVHESVLHETKSSLRTHWLRLDAAGRPRTSALAERLAREVLDYCIPRQRIEEAREFLEKTRSTSKIVALHEEAVGLFTRLKNSGEGGELLLYFLLEIGLRIPQILCKMALKTNSEMHVHGVDGVHALALPNGELAVYWGESKVYASFAAAARECLKSITPYLLDDGSGPIRRDIMLARDHLSVDDAEVALKLVQFFTSDSEEANHLHVRGACLVGFSRDDYKSPYLDDGVTVDPAILAEIEQWTATLRSRVVDSKVDSVEIEIFCLPLPSADEFRTALRKALGLDQPAR